MPDRTERTVGEVYELLAHVHLKTCRLETLLTGGERPEQGLIVRVDRIEQSRNFWQKFGWLVLSAVIAPELFFAAWFLFVR